MSSILKIGIVGADATKWSPYQIPSVKTEIERIIHVSNHWNFYNYNKYKFSKDKIVDIIVISGHSPKGGVDVWAEEIADRFGLKKEIYPPRSKCPECNNEDLKIENLGGGFGVRFVCEPSVEVLGNPRYCAMNRRTGEPHSYIISWRIAWKDYRARNIKIARAADILYVISQKCSNCDGVGYTGRPEQNTTSPLDGMTHWQRPCMECGGNGRKMGSGRVWNGGVWTGECAEKLGKKVTYIDL